MSITLKLVISKSPNQIQIARKIGTSAFCYRKIAGVQNMSTLKALTFHSNTCQSTPCHVEFAKSWATIEKESKREICHSTKGDTEKQIILTARKHRSTRFPKGLHKLYMRLCNRLNPKSTRLSSKISADFQNAERGVSLNHYFRQIAVKN